MAIQGLIFDFDGLIIDTEMPEYQAWREEFQQQGTDLPLEVWVQCVGASYDAFNPYVYLEERTGRTVDRQQVQDRVRLRAAELMAAEEILPGVLDLIRAAREKGLKLAVASSSPRDWVYGHLERLQMLKCFDTICTGDQVERVKPDPALYRCAINRLGLTPGQGIAFEDSLNGILAARAAGLFTVAVPNGVTGDLNFEQADLILDSLSELTLDELLQKAARSNGRIS